MHFFKFSYTVFLKVNMPLPRTQTVRGMLYGADNEYKLANQNFHSNYFDHLWREVGDICLAFKNIIKKLFIS